MDERLAILEFDRRPGDQRTLRTGLSENDVVGILRALDGEPDVTVTISRDGTDERMLVAVSGALAFLGLDGPDGVYQFVSHEPRRRGTQRLMIGGQTTDIESRSVLCVEPAARVAFEWLTRGRQSSFGTWERK